MPVEEPRNIGDVAYPQYSRTGSEFIKDALAIIKGHVYTLDAAGRLIVPISTAGVADLTKGAHQAKSAAVAPTAEDTDEVQVLKAGSRIILKADISLVPGQEVALKSVTTTTTADKCMAAPSPRDKGFLGRIFEILTLGTDGAKKQVTADNDLVVIDLEV